MFQRQQSASTPGCGLSVSIRPGQRPPPPVEPGMSEWATDSSKQPRLLCRETGYVSANPDSSAFLRSSTSFPSGWAPRLPHVASSITHRLGRRNTFLRFPSATGELVVRRRRTDAKWNGCATVSLPAHRPSMGIGNRFRASGLRFCPWPDEQRGISWPSRSVGKI